MSFEKQKRLVERLLDKTRGSELSWQESVRSDEFQVAFPNSGVQIRSIKNGNFTDFYISLIDSSGRIVDGFSQDQLDQDGPHKSGPWSHVLGELHALARRSALNSDQVIENILAEIE